MFERTDPKTLMRWLILAAIVYFLLPWDLFPDVLGVPGRIDDLLMMAWLAWFYRNHVRQFVATSSGDDSSGHSSRSGFGQDSGNESAAGSPDPKALDAYEVLGVPRSASSEAIRVAYHSRMKE